MENKENKEWSICYVSGGVTTCDPGCNRYYPYSKSYKREEILKGMNLCEYNEDLPTIKVKSIKPDCIEVMVGGVARKLTIGQKIEAPIKGLSYAYSDATIWIE